jgi:hypothetical protein
VVKLTVVHWRRKRQQHHHHQQHTSCRTIVSTFTSPDNMDLFNFYLQYLKFGDYQEVDSIKNTKPFHYLHMIVLVDDSLYVFGRWCTVDTFSPIRRPSPYPHVGWLHRQSSTSLSSLPRCQHHSRRHRHQCEIYLYSPLWSPCPPNVPLSLPFNSVPEMRNSIEKNFNRRYPVP